jgi:chromosome segregation ATPase
VICLDKNSLFEILLDPSSNDAEKDDAVIELGINFQDEETVDMLIKVSNDNNYDEMIAASCGESLGHIWLTTQQINYEKLSYLKGIALSEVLSLIKVQRPDWYKTYLELSPKL